MIAMADDKNDNVIRDPVLDARVARVDQLAEDDARADRDPQVLTGELADLQDHYEDIYQQTLVELLTERSRN